MSVEGQTIPDETAQRVARLINEAEDMRAQAVDDLKTIYGDLREELKALGWAGQNVSKEVAALKGAIAEMRLDEEKKAKREEKGDRVDDYVSILSKGRARAPARTRENIEQSGEGIDPKLAHTIVTGLQTETGRAALVAAVDILIEREEAEERRFDGGLDIVTKHTEIAAASQGEAEVPSTEDVNPRDSGGSGANAGGDDVEGGAVRADRCDLEELEPSGPDVNRATNSPEQATKSGADTDPGETAAEGICKAVTAGETATEFNGIRYEATPPRPMKSLPYASCFPELSHAHYQQLTDSIANNGVREPIVRMGDVIVDGWSRYNISRSLGIEYPVVSYLGNDVLLDVIAWQREARQFTAAQERQIAGRLAKEIPHRAADIMAAFSLTEAAEKEMA